VVLEVRVGASAWDVHLEGCATEEWALVSSDTNNMPCFLWDFILCLLSNLSALKSWCRLNPLFARFTSQTFANTGIKMS
jgi:hypothetical protein